MDPVLALIGDLYQQVVDLRQDNLRLQQALEEARGQAAASEVDRTPPPDGYEPRH